MQHARHARLGVCCGTACRCQGSSLNPGRVESTQQSRMWRKEQEKDFKHRAEAGATRACGGRLACQASASKLWLEPLGEAEALAALVYGLEQPLLQLFLALVLEQVQLVEAGVGCAAGRRGGGGGGGVCLKRSSAINESEVAGRHVLTQCRSASSGAAGRLAGMTTPPCAAPEGRRSVGPYALCIWNFWGPCTPCSALNPSSGTLDVPATRSSAQRQWRISSITRALLLAGGQAGGRVGRSSMWCGGGPYP
jgi:hypothetical protein